MAQEPVVIVRSPLALRLRWPLFYALVLGAWAILLALHGMGGDHGRADAAHVIGMWAVMGIAMMAPTALPTIRAYAALADRAPGGARGGFWAFLAGFAAPWALFALAAAALQLLLRRLELVDRAGDASLWSAAALLALAAAYQLAPAKRACVGRCRVPAAVMAERFRPGALPAAQLGARHGLDCVGSCWALMLLALAAGAAALPWMGIAMLVMGLEKMPVVGWRVTRPLAAVLGAAAVGAAVLALL